jgi:peptidoglycan/xylan/chitin deacetylase (PgdA/CDA1 family)
MAMRARVLTYHSGNLAGNDYATNNLVALAQDLDTLRSLSIPVVPLRSIVAARLEGACERLPARVAAITLDDGLDFDYEDLVHPFHGPQSSVRAVLERHEREHGLRVHATTFVIASPEARREIARREMLDHQWIGDHWWAAAVASGRFDVGNHSWDHVSPSVTPTGRRDERSGSFRHVTSFEDAELEVRVAREFIAARAPNPATAFFAYPYGDASDYVADDYLPRHGERNGTIAAFTGHPGPLHEASDRWRLPRYTCGMDWRSTSELARIFDD